MFYSRISINHLPSHISILATAILLLVLSGCNLPYPGISTTGRSTPTQLDETIAPSPTPETGEMPMIEEPLPPDETPTSLPPAGSQVYFPLISASGEGSTSPEVPKETGPQLAFITDNDLWLVNPPDGTPRQLTQSGDVLSFVWAWDGERLATFNGHSLCFVQRDGSVRTACLELGLDDTQALIPRQMVWSPDQEHIVLWNPFNPWDEGAIGWLIVALDGSGDTWRIEDPVDWGLAMAPNNEPGGITGQPLFLADGTLIGTLTHRWMCGSSGCHYQLYQFDLVSRGFTPYPNKPEEGWSEGQSLALSIDHNRLVNFGTFYSGCESYTTFADVFELNSQTRQILNLEQETLSGLSLSPDASQAVIARNAGCSSENQATWSTVCGLSQGFDVYAMQLWDLDTNQRSDLYPGLFPTWSPDGNWIAFNSCLTQVQSDWKPSESKPPSIYIMDVHGDGVTFIAEGSSPAWRP